MKLSEPTLISRQTILSRRTFEFGSVTSGTSERVVATEDESMHDVRWGTLLLRVHALDIASAGSYLDVWLEAIDRHPEIQFVTDTPAAIRRITSSTTVGLHAAPLRLGASPMVRLVIDGFRQGWGGVGRDQRRPGHEVNDELWLPDADVVATHRVRLLGGRQDEAGRICS
jgi:hypothetical protein